MDISPYLLSPLVAWFTPQVIKYLVYVGKKNNPRDMSFLYQSGNMPSVHTAAVVSVTTAIGVMEGVHSSIFALALVFSIIIAYDAMQVRRAAGEQGLAIDELLAKANLIIKPYKALGHKPIEVAAGGAIGVLSAYVSLSF